jgi:hypothetical protein
VIWLLRCAYYGKGNITAKEMKAGFGRDGDAFAFAALFNTSVYSGRDLQQLVEDEFLAGRELWALYNKHQALVSERKKQRDLFFGKGAEGGEQSSVKESTAVANKRLNELTSASSSRFGKKRG